jgi:hypothetical protein
MRDRTIYKPFQVVTVEDLLRDSEFCQKYGAWITNIIGANRVTFAGLELSGCVLRRPGGADVAWDNEQGVLILQPGWTFLLAPLNDIAGAGVVKLDKVLYITDTKLEIPASRVGQSVYVMMRLADPEPSGDSVPRVYVDPLTGARTTHSERVYEAQAPMYAVANDPNGLRSLLEQGYQIAFILTMGQGGQKIINPAFIFPEFAEGIGAGSVAAAIAGLAIRLFEARGEPLTRPLSVRSLAQVNNDIATINQRLSVHDTDVALIKAALVEITKVTALDRIYVAKSDIQCGTQTWAIINHYDRFFARYAQIDNATGVIHLRAGTYLVSVSVDWVIATDAVVHFGVLTASGPDLVGEIPFSSSHRLFYRKRLWEFQQNTDIVLGVQANTYPTVLTAAISADFEQVQLP